MDLFSNNTSDVIGKALDGTAMRHKAIATNIANAETPGFKGFQVDFEAQLRQAIDSQSQSQQGGGKFLAPGMLKTTSGKHLNSSGVAVGTLDSGTSIQNTQFDYRIDQNEVDVEMEMAHLAKNSTRFGALARMQHKIFENYRAAMKGGY